MTTIDTPMTPAPLPGAGPGPEPEPPSRQVGPGAWLRANLFSTPFNTVLTIVFGALLGWLAFRALRFVFVTTDWEIIRRNLRQFMVGLFPEDEVWRVWASLYVAAAGIGFVAGAAPRSALRGIEEGEGGEPARSPLVGFVRRAWPLGLLLGGVLAQTRTIGPTLLVLVGLGIGVVAWGVGRVVPLRVAGRWPLVFAAAILLALVLPGIFGGVRQAEWGGFHLTLYVSVIGIAASFPLGLLVALARRSSLPLLRVLASAYVEVFRGVPLITLLFMSEAVLLFLFPTSVDPWSDLNRAIVAIAVFESAYIAEIIRGGLKAVPSGQYEAARALGLSPYRVMRRVVMPQGLRAVIPAIVGQFISAYKDTTLLFIIGTAELLRIADRATSQPDFLAQGLQGVTFAFVGFLFWVGSFMMSRESQRIERRLGVGER
jgi:general L-amino acid transport system permease protein